MTENYQTIDIEPTYVDLMQVVRRGADVGILAPACRVTDMIRKLQKEGYKEVTLSLEGGVTVIGKG